MKFPAVTSRRLKLVFFVAALVIVLALLWFAGRTEQEGQKADDNAAVVRSFADQAAEACADPAQRLELAEAGFSCSAIEKAAERVDDGDTTLIPGPRGATGPTGPPGADGRDGFPGATGPRGATGPAGKAGEPGLPGPTGEPGVDGQRGDNGPPGAPGKDGAAGTTGADGAQGPRGEQGPPGEQGPRGEAGTQGPQGDRGADGQPGAPGRGITAISCDSVTPFVLTVTYSDGTTATYSCGPGSPAK